MKNNSIYRNVLNLRLKCVEYLTKILIRTFSNKYMYAFSNCVRFNVSFPLIFGYAKTVLPSKFDLISLYLSSTF